MIIDETDGAVMIGANCEIFETAILTGPLSIGDDVYIGPYAVVGGPPQHRGSYPAPISAPVRTGGVRIENRACIREFVQVHQGILGETIIARDSLVMSGSHVSHDSQLGAGVTLATNTILGGFTRIDDDATFGQSVVTHPWALIGEGSMVGLNASVIRDVPPYAKVLGSPARIIGSNTHRDATLPAEYLADALSVGVRDRWARLLGEREDRQEAWRCLNV